MNNQKPNTDTKNADKPELHGLTCSAMFKPGFSKRWKYAIISKGDVEIQLNHDEIVTLLETLAGRRFSQASGEMDGYYPKEIYLSGSSNEG